MVEKRKPIDRSPYPRTDVCIIGAGPAGAIVAYNLSKMGHDVVILEAGPRFDHKNRIKKMEQDIRTDNGSIWNMGGKRDSYSSTGSKFYPLNQSRVKGVGGTTLHWQGMVMRLHQKDFKMNTEYGLASNWPISYQDLQEYYFKAEKELGVAGDLDNPFSPPRKNDYPLPGFPQSYSDSIFTEACENLDIKTHSVPNARNSEPYDGSPKCVAYGTCDPICPSGAKYDATRHIRKAEKNGVKVIDRAPVQKLKHDKKGERVESAVYITPSGEKFQQKARHFVLAAGGVEIPRLLLLSKSKKYPDGLANSSGLVGKYFFDHLFAGSGGIADISTRQNHIGFITSESHQFYDQESSEIGSIKLEFLNYAGPSPVEIALTSDLWGDNLLEHLKDTYGNNIAIGGLVEQIPKKENCVTLDKSKTDNHGNPVPNIKWSIDSRVKKTIKEANKIQHRILSEIGVDIKWTIGPKNTGPAFHHMGTTRMGEDPNRSVVDKRLRTHDIDNLSIASSSVFVTGGAMNPTLTIVALALKCAEEIDLDL